MLTILGKLMGKMSGESGREEVKCPCGEVVMRVPSEDTEIYLCKKCNKLLYYVEPSQSLFKIRPLSLAWLKKKH